MIWRSDESIDNDKNIVAVGIADATERVCDVIGAAIRELSAVKFRLSPTHKLNPQFSDKDMVQLGKAFAESILDNLVDDPSIDFRKVLKEVLDEDETVLNADFVHDAIKTGTIEALVSAKKGGAF